MRTAAQGEDSSDEGPEFPQGFHPFGPDMFYTYFRDMYEQDVHDAYDYDEYDEDDEDDEYYGM